MNFSGILSSAGTALTALAAAGLPIPAALVSTIDKAVPAAQAASDILAAAKAPANLPAAILELLPVAKTLVPVGEPTADAAIASILKEVESVGASLANLESGQVVPLASFSATIGGAARTAHVVLFLDGGPAAQALGL